MTASFQVELIVLHHLLCDIRLSGWLLHLPCSGFNRSANLQIASTVLKTVNIVCDRATISDIERFIDRIGEITDEVISAEDILARAKVAAGVDVGKTEKGQRAE